MDRSEKPSPTYLRFCTAHDPAARIAAHVDLAFECLAREEARAQREAVLRDAVSAARGKVAA